MQFDMESKILEAVQRKLSTVHCAIIDASNSVCLVQLQQSGFSNRNRSVLVSIYSLRIEFADSSVLKITHIYIGLLMQKF